MRGVATFPDEQGARLFADVLSVQDIETQVSEGPPGAFTVWVLEEGKVEESRAAYAAFARDPQAPEHAAASGAVERKRRAAGAARERSLEGVVAVRRAWSPGAGSTRATVAIAVLSVAATLVTRMGADGRLFSHLMIGPPEEFGRPFEHILRGEVWRLFTPALVHLGVLHILFNMWWFVDLGGVVERRVGTPAFLGLVLFTAAVSNAAQYAFVGSPFFGGMSGVLYALFGYVWVRGKLDPGFGLGTPPSTAVVLLVWLGLGFTGSLGSVANVCHVSGLVAGAVAGALHRSAPRRRRA